MLSRVISRVLRFAALTVLVLWLSSAWGQPPVSRPNGSAPEPDAARAAEEVFRDPAFWWKRIETKEISLSWPEKVIAAILDLIARGIRAVWELIKKILEYLFGGLTGHWSVSRAVAWVAIAALLAWSIWKLYPLLARWLGSEPWKKEPGQLPDLQTLAEAHVLIEQAAAALREGRYADAVRLALLALIASLQKRQLLRFDPARTNREYQSELRGMPELALPFGQLAAIYERIWYGRLPAGRADAERALSLCGSLIDMRGPASE